MSFGHIGSHIRKSLCANRDVIVVQSLSHVRLLETPSIAAQLASLPFIISWSLLKLMSIELVLLSNHLILCCSLLLLPSIFPSIRGFSVMYAWNCSSPHTLCLGPLHPAWLRGGGASRQNKNPHLLGVQVLHIHHLLQRGREVDTPLCF